MSGEGGPLAAKTSGDRSVRAVARERDGFAALLGAFARQVDRDAQSGLMSPVRADVLRSRIGTMVEQVALGLHLTAAAVDDQHVSRPRSGRGR